MERERLIPQDPLGFIRRCVEAGKILWTYHVNMRPQGRSISRGAIVDSTSTFEIVEAYPGDKYLPSYLVFAEHEEEVIHILFATDTEGDNVRVITAYRPNPEEWEKDLRTRRTP
ncbi:hypothetical protein BH23GEM7_BH23GEM7_29060 [soil metagenome]